MRFLKRLLAIDWFLFSALIPIVAAGLVTMYSFSGDNYFATRQIIWAIIGIATFFLASTIDWRFLRSSKVLLILYFIGLLLLGLLFFTARIKGAQSWFDTGLFAIQPTDLIKLVLISLLAKFLSKRHVEIKHFRHILISAIYALVPFVFILLQPDFGSALIVFLIWIGMIVVSGVSKKHLALVIGSGVLAFLVLWMFVFAPYQKARILTFVDPLRDPQGTGYNALQSMVAVGSGQVLGKGIGHGTQSRLAFLPEYQTDFIFAAYAEEWGLVGVFILFSLYGILLWRVLKAALTGATNFEIYFGVGVALMLMGHFVINVGMNMGLLPVTGLTLPFMSYGGSHLIVEFLALGMLMGMRRYSYGIHKEDTNREFLGIEQSASMNL